LGCRLRESGHSLVPDPPARITGTMRPALFFSVVISPLDQLAANPST
jgi:hypothetical protein